MIKTRTKSGQQLKEFMKSIGLTPVDLACRLSPPVERQTVIRWYDGSRIPSIDYQQQLYKLSDKKVLLSGWMTEKDRIRENWLKKHPIHEQSGNTKSTKNTSNGTPAKTATKAPTNGVVHLGKPRQRATKRGSTQHERSSDDSSSASPGSASDTAGRSAAVHPGEPRIGVRAAEQTDETVRGEHTRRASESIVQVVENPESRKVTDNTGNAGTSSKISATPALRRDESVVAGSQSSVNGSKNGGTTGNGATGNGAASKFIGMPASRPIATQPVASKPVSKPIVSPPVSKPVVKTTNAIVNGQAPSAVSPETSRSNHESNTESAKSRTSVSPVAESAAASTDGPIRKNHSECSPDNAMERMRLAKSGGIQFEIVDTEGVVLECHQDVVTARNILDSRIHPTSYAVRCKFCWTEVSIYTPPRPEVTERLARSISDGHAKVDA